MGAELYRRVFLLTHFLSFKLPLLSSLTSCLFPSSVNMFLDNFFHFSWFIYSVRRNLTPSPNSCIFMLMFTLGLSVKLLSFGVIMARNSITPHLLPWSLRPYWHSVSFLLTMYLSTKWHVRTSVSDHQQCCPFTLLPSPPSIRIVGWSIIHSCPSSKHYLLNFYPKCCPFHQIVQ